MRQYAECRVIDKFYQGPNTLAYLTGQRVTKKKCFVTLTPVSQFLKQLLLLLQLQIVRDASNATHQRLKSVVVVADFTTFEANLPEFRR